MLCKWYLIPTCVALGNQFRCFENCLKPCHMFSVVCFNCTFAAINSYLKALLFFLSDTVINWIGLFQKFLNIWFSLSSINSCYPLCLKKLQVEVVFIQTLFLSGFFSDYIAFYKFYFIQCVKALRNNLRNSKQLNIYHFFVYWKIFPHKKSYKDTSLSFASSAKRVLRTCDFQTWSYLPSFVLISF